MEHRSRFSTLNASYNDFLFATVCDEANGMRLSVLSALARMNVDPWEEATRLAAMPKAIAERTLVSILGSILDLASGRNGNSPDAAATAARLVRLLPGPDKVATETATNAPAGIVKATAQMKTYWWVWVGFALAMSFMTPHHQATTASPGIDSSDIGAPATARPGAASVPSKSGAVVPPKSNNMVPEPVALSR